MMVFPWVANLDVKDIKLSIVDNDHSTYSERLVNKIASSEYFYLTNASNTYSEAIESIELSESDIILEIAHSFENSLIKEGYARVMISANSVNGTKGGLGSSYLARIVNDFADEIRSELIPPNNTFPVIDINSQYRYNAYLDYKTFMIPALMTVLLAIISGFLPALNIVGEKEKGTIEQINVTPISKFTFILAKLIPYWTIGFVVLTICFGLATLIYGLSPVGNLGIIYLFAMLFVLTFSGFGLVISNHSSTMRQAMFVMFFFTIIIILMSGIFTPVNSMPQWAQAITIFNPLKYFIQVMRAVYLKGSNIWALSTQLMALLSFAVFFILWAMLSYRKKA
jgi:ABC-2 type transport system permease protein